MTKPLSMRLGIALGSCLLAGCGHPASADEQPDHGPSDERMLLPTDFKGLAWRSMGPANMGGRIADIAIAPGNAKTFYVAFGTGGLFKTTNNGTTFAPVFDEYDTASIGSVAVADAPADWPGWEKMPAAPEGPGDVSERVEAGKARIVWVGTGEGNGRNSSSWGHGVYRSTDGGEHFDHLGLEETHDIPRLAADPGNPDVCYAAAMGHLWGANPERGVYKTSDGGKTFEKILYVDENTGACDVMVNPSDPNVLYAAMYTRRRTAYSFQSGGPGGGIFRSTDAGQSWKKLTQGLPAQTGRIGLDIHRKNPRILMAVIESDQGGSPNDTWDDRSKVGGVFRSEDGGDTWERVFERSPRSFYFAKIRIDPEDDQRVYLLGWRVAVSDDGGRHFRAGGARKPHVDMHAMVIDPADTDHLLLGNDGGLYVSYDRSLTWDFLNHLPVGEFYNIACDLSDPYRIGGGMQDNGSWIGPSANLWESGPESMGESGNAITNQDWRFVNNGDGFHVAFDPTDPNIMYAESQGGSLVRIHLGTGVRKIISPAPKEGQQRFRFNWNSPFLISPHDPTVLYLGGNHVFKLTARGDFWEAISPDLSTRDVEKIQTVGSEAETHCTVVSLAESPLMAGVLWAGTDDGLIHLTQDAGTNWVDVTPAQVNGMYVAKIEASHHEAGTAYVAIDGHRSDDFEARLLMTTDAGRTWKAVSGDLPNGGATKVVREDQANPNVLYVGTERGCFVSIDRGGHWTRLNGESLPTVAIDDLLQHPRERDLIVGTHGRSIYVLDDASPLSQLTPDIVQSEFHLFDIMPGKPKRFLPYGGLWSDRMFAAKNPPLGARITYWIRDYDGEEVKLTITDQNGTTVRELEGTNRPGLNRVVWDLQYDKHDKFNNPDSFLKQTQFVPAGQYTVKIKYGDHAASKPAQVLPAPE